MSRLRREPLDVLNYVVKKHQPLKMRDVRNFASCYVCFKGWEKADMFALVRKHFDVDDKNFVRIKNGI